MNSRAFTLSLVIAAIAVFMTYSYIESEEKNYLEQYGNPQPVVIAKEDIGELELIDDTKVQIVNVPAKFRMPGHLKRIEEVYNTIATVPIKAGEQITSPRVTQPGARTGLAQQVSVGKRAYSINITESQAVGKLIKPGDRVDVLALVNYAPGQLEKMQVRTILQDVLVLSTGNYVTNSLPVVAIQRDEELRKMNLNTYTNYNTVTLELEPIQVQKLVFLTNTSSRLQLSLRNNDDKNIQNLGYTEIFDVLGEDAAAAKEYYQKKNQGQIDRNRASQ